MNLGFRPLYIIRGALPTPHSSGFTLLRKYLKERAHQKCSPHPYSIICVANTRSHDSFLPTMSAPTLIFNYDISCPFAYIASTRVRALAERTNAALVYRPVLLGAIYRATSAPQGAAGSASDVFNPTKKKVAGQSMQRTLKRYIKY